MHQFSFEAMGTAWTILIDQDDIRDSLATECIALSQHFEEHFSRFILTNEVCAFREAEPGTYEVSSTLAELLSFAQKLKKITGGRFDPGVAELLEKAGYNREYTFLADKNMQDWQAPNWSIHGRQFKISGPITIDTGGFGKGYWIDQLSRFLTEEGYAYHLVDGGGDMAGTTKKNGEPWHIAIEWPGKTGIAAGEIDLQNTALAVSDVFKRAWGNWHHVINPITKQPVQSLIGCAVQASSALVADGLTTALMVSEPPEWEKIAQKFDAEYVMFTHDSKVIASSGWPGTLFTAP